MEDFVWRVKVQSQELQTLRDSIRGLWDDDAAREINSRYLNPHQDDAKQILTALLVQSETLDQLQLHLQNADEREQAAKAHAVIVQRSLEFAREETRYAISQFDQSLQQAVVVRENLPQIFELIQNAELSCRS